MMKLSGPGVRIPRWVLGVGWLVSVVLTVLWFHLNPASCPVLTGYQVAQQQTFDCTNAWNVWWFEQGLLIIGYGIVALVLRAVRWTAA